MVINSEATPSEIYSQGLSYNHYRFRNNSLINNNLKYYFLRLSLKEKYIYELFFQFIL